MVQRNAQEPDLLNVVDSLTALAGRGASTGDLRFENEKKKWVLFPSRVGGHCDIGGGVGRGARVQIFSTFQH